MEGNFETSGGSGGSSGGGSMPDPGGSIEFDSAGGISDSGGLSSYNSNFTSFDYLKDGVDKGYYTKDTEGIFSMEEVMSEAQEEMYNSENEPEWDVMNIPGTAHQKLEALSKGDSGESRDSELNEAVIAEDKNDKEVDREKDPNENVDEAKKEQEDKNDLELKEGKELSFEQQVIKLQAETMKLMAEGMKSNINKKELEELMKKLKELIDEAEKDKKGKKASLLTGLFSAVIILIEAGEKGYKMVENEVKEAEKA